MRVMPEFGRPARVQVLFPSRPESRCRHDSPPYGRDDRRIHEILLEIKRVSVVNADPFFSDAESINRLTN